MFSIFIGYAYLVSIVNLINMCIICTSILKFHSISVENFVFFFNSQFV